MRQKRIYFLIVSLGIVLFLVSALSTMNPNGPNEFSIVKSDAYNIAVEVPGGPVAEDDAYDMFEDSVLEVDAASGVMANDYDPNAGALSVILLSEPSYGAFNLYADGSFTYTPNSNWFGVDSFDYELSDGSSTDGATATITVIGVNDPPVAGDDYVETDEDIPVIIDYIANDYDIDDGTFDLIEYQFVDSDLHGEVEWDIFEVQPGVFRMALMYTPDPNWYGSTSTLQYYLADSSGAYSNLAVIHITVNPVDDEPLTTLTYTGQLSGVYSDPVNLEASLIDSSTQLPLEGQTIQFIFGDDVYYAITDVDGIASIMVVIDYPAGVYSLSVSFEGTSEYLPSSDTVEFTVLRESAYAFYTGFTVISSNKDLMMLRATIFDDADGYWGDMSRINITFTIYLTKGTSTEVLQILGPYSVQMTEVEGVGFVVIYIPTLPPDSYYIVVSLEEIENIYYELPETDEVPIVVAEPTRDSVKGGGWIWDSSDSKGTFSFVVKYHKHGQLTGQALYIYRDGDWIYFVKSYSWIGLAFEDDHAFFEAYACIYRFNTETWDLEYLGHDFLVRIDVWDDGRDDIFQIIIYDKNGLIFHVAGDEPLGELIGGSIKIHTDRKWTYCHCHKHKMKKSHHGHRCGH